MWVGFFVKNQHKSRVMDMSSFMKYDWVWKSRNGNSTCIILLKATNYCQYCWKLLDDKNQRLWL